MVDGRSRALLTEADRESLREESTNRRYQAAHRARNRIEKNLSEDVRVMKENHPDLYYQFVQTVTDVVPCVEMVDDGTVEESPDKRSDRLGVLFQDIDVDMDTATVRDLVNYISSLEDQVDGLESG